MQPEPFGLYSERILELCNYTFSRMYRNVFQQYWHNGSFHRVNHNHCSTDWEEGRYEVYVPTQENMDWNMQYYRVVIQVLPEIDRATIQRELPKTISKQKNTPAGRDDSELVCFIAPHRTMEAKKKKQFLRGFRHVAKPGYFTAIIISQWPEQCFKRLMTLICSFLQKRIGKLLEKLKVQPWEIDYTKEQNLHIFYYIYNRIINLPLSLQNTLRCLSHSLSWLIDRLKDVFNEIGRQNIMNQAVREVSELKNSLATLRSIPKPLQSQREPWVFKELVEILNVVSGKGG